MGEVAEGAAVPTPRLAVFDSIAADWMPWARAFEAAPALVAITAGPGHVVAYLNPAFRAVFGDRLLGVPAGEALADVDDRLMAALDTVYRDRRPVSRAEEPINHPPAGAERLRRGHFTLNFSPIAAPTLAASSGADSGAGVVAGVLIIGVDVTEAVASRRALEAAERVASAQQRALMISEARYRALVEASAIDAWRADGNGLLLDDMPHWRDITGQPAGSVAGSGWLAGVHPEDRARVTALWQAAVAARAPYECEFRLLRPDGASTYVLSRGLPFELDREHTIEYVGTTHDISEQRRQQDAQRRRALTLETLGAATAAVNAEMDRDRALQRLADVVAGRLGEICRVVLPDRPTGLLNPSASPAEVAGMPLRQVALAVAAGVATPPPGVPVQIYPEDNPIRTAIATGRVIVRPVEPGRRPPWASTPNTSRWPQELAVHSVAAAPMRSRGRTLGAISVMAGPGRPPYGHTELALLAELASRAAVAVEHAEAYDFACRTATTLQEHLLPDPSRWPAALPVAVRYVSGVADASAGGDFYDVVALPGDRLAVIVGDVMGHGVMSAAMMGQLRVAARAYAQLDLPPDEALARLDQLLGSISDTHIATCLYSVLDLGDRILTLASAGHPPPVTVSQAGQARFPPVEPGPPLGSGAGARPAVTTLGPLAAGSLLAFFTDGLVEDRARDLDTGLARLAQVLAAQAAEPDLERICDRVLTGMGRRDGSDDDVALLVARVP